MLPWVTGTGQALLNWGEADAQTVIPSGGLWVAAAGVAAQVSIPQSHLQTVSIILPKHLVKLTSSQHVFGDTSGSGFPVLFLRPPCPCVLNILQGPAQAGFPWHVHREHRHMLARTRLSSSYVGPVSVSLAFSPSSVNSRLTFE